MLRHKTLRCTFSCINCIILRRKHKDTHWSVIAKKKNPKYKALQHFDDLYKSFYGSQWPSIRVALLSESKYCAVVNNFGDSEETIIDLKKHGCVDIRDVFKADLQSGDILKVPRKRVKKSFSDRNEKSTLNINQQSGECHERVVGENDQNPNSASEEQPSETSTLSAASLRSQLSNPETEYDRIVKPDPSGGVISAGALQEFIPATKLKGLEDWVLESDHYSGYLESADFPVLKKKEQVLQYPQYWNIFAHIRGDVADFPHPRRGKTGVYNYYLLDAASILPVLALDLSKGDKVLDMCAAPGGKSFLILQTLYPGFVVSNDVTVSRVRRIKGVFDDYFFKLKDWDKKINVSLRDGRSIDEDNLYNKILVDVPCTTDRHSVMEDDNNIFNPVRLKERIRLPQLQTELLSNAMRIVRPGGTVVYSTCSMSPVQNDGVVHMALKKIWEETKIEMEVRNMTHALQVTKNVFKFATTKELRYGHVVIPFLPNNFGPMYFCKLVRKK
ncbi:5-cytosine rRNA methyltransferase NSUN4 [Hetaerina americana]|uniref:5-cytosine rRNA methyltransferase NSUN4 n=1 Tax=Hetaerina americana TaxID=62018 RepID=UPI003A7F4244